jgi:hypothetical protein
MRDGSWSFDLDDQLDHVDEAGAIVFQEGFDSAAIVDDPGLDPELASSEKWGPQTQYYLPVGNGFDSFTLPPGWTFDGLTVLPSTRMTGTRPSGSTNHPLTDQ